MDIEQAGAVIAKELHPEEGGGIGIQYGTVLGRRADGMVTVEVERGTIAARAMASFDVGASVGSTVMLIGRDNTWTVMGAMADVGNSHDFSDAVEQIGEAVAGVDEMRAYMEFDADGLHVGKRATSAGGSQYQTAETLMGADGTFAVLSPDGTPLARYGPARVDIGVGSRDAVVTFCKNSGWTRYQGGIYQMAAIDSPIALFTQRCDGGEYINVYVGNEDPRFAGSLFCQRQYAGVFCGDGSSASFGSGGFVAVGMQGGKSFATVRADFLGLAPRGGAAQVNVPLSDAAALLSGPSVESVDLDYPGARAVRNQYGIVEVFVNGVDADVPGGWGTALLGTLPAGWRPADTVFAPLLNIYGGSGYGPYFEITAGGEVRVSNPMQAAVASNLNGNVCFLAS